MFFTLRFLPVPPSGTSACNTPSIFTSGILSTTTQVPTINVRRAECFIRSTRYQVPYTTWIIDTIRAHHTRGTWGIQNNATSIDRQRQQRGFHPESTRRNNMIRQCTKDKTKTMKQFSWQRFIYIRHHNENKTKQQKTTATTTALPGTSTAATTTQQPQTDQPRAYKYGTSILVVHSIHPFIHHRSSISQRTTFELPNQHARNN